MLFSHLCGTLQGVLIFLLAGSPHPLPPQESLMWLASFLFLGNLPSLLHRGVVGQWGKEVGHKRGLRKREQFLKAYRVTIWHEALLCGHTQILARSFKRYFYENLFRDFLAIYKSLDWLTSNSPPFCISHLVSSKSCSWEYLPPKQQWNLERAMHLFLLTDSESTGQIQADLRPGSHLYSWVRYQLVSPKSRKHLSSSLIGSFETGSLIKIRVVLTWHLDGEEKYLGSAAFLPQPLHQHITNSLDQSHAPLKWVMI